MAGTGNRRGGGNRRSSHRSAAVADSHSDQERWLLTYADMLTLLFALFMVLFAISSLNISKFEQLKASLQDAFSGKILPGGESVLERGAQSRGHDTASQALVPASAAAAAQAIAQQDATFERLKEMIDGAARSARLQGSLRATVERRGLVVHLVTDGVAFDSASAVLKPEIRPLLTHVGKLLSAPPASNDVLVQGYTDTIPIHSSQYPTNWELSTARASSVVRFLIGAGMAPKRLGAAGYAYQHPLASNATAAGRSRNRRVEIVLVRTSQGTP
ncbi:MAG TPA: flagellar motor protein MotB [Solirubrobacteraceae bacterium]|nr:flagellar motor protein MotB [Solirubrobacteraceae bacterium]